MTEFNRRNFAGAVVGGAAALAATPALAQRRRFAPAGPAALTAGDWFAQVRAQHAAIDRQFQVVKGAVGPARRAIELKTLATLLTAHSIAEEVALYPGVSLNVDRAEGDLLYKQQQEAKVLTTEIDNLVAMRRDADFVAKVEALEAAVKAHVAEEENDAYPRLVRAAGPAMNAKMTADFRMSFTRYYNG